MRHLTATCLALALSPLALAAPRNVDAARSRVKKSLAHLYTLQMSFFGDNDRYDASLKSLGFTPEKGDEAAYSCVAAKETFVCTGRFTAAGVAETWTINDQKELKKAK